MQWEEQWILLSKDVDGQMLISRGFTWVQCNKGE